MTVEIFKSKVLKSKKRELKERLLHFVSRLFSNNAAKIELNYFAINVGSVMFFFFNPRVGRRGILFIEDYSAGNDGKCIAIVYSSNPRRTAESRAHYSSEQNRWPRARNFGQEREQSARVLIFLL